MEIEKLGTNYGGWGVPSECLLNKDSIVYCAGVGEDISFDLLLHNKYKSNMILIDPTNRAKIYYDKVVEYFNEDKHKQEFDKTYLGDFHFKPDFSKFTFIDKGLWNCETELKFYKQSNPLYVSQTLIENMYTNTYDIVKTTTIKKIMEECGHTHIDLIKMDIEGAEIVVIEDMIANNILPKYILVEFDLKDKNRDHDGLTEKLIVELEIHSYTIYYRDNANVCFIKR
jgi:hypothetical protein